MQQMMTETNWAENLLSEVSLQEQTDLEEMRSNVETETFLAWNHLTSTGSEYSELQVQLLSCQQRLDEIEKSTLLLIRASKTLVESSQKQQEFGQHLQQNLYDLQQTLQSLSNVVSRSPVPDLKPLEEQVRQINSLLCHQDFNWKQLGAWVAISAAFWGLVFIICLPAYQQINKLQSKQQRLLNQIFVCVIRPTTQLCADLRQSMDAQELPNSKP
ncbi:MAG: hypothetical protein SFW36_01045 [Leptolyngbyaceae cyanobacterium bins.59]|nr:hypothetical protein [Leptolyngbyaceae cyanobacterium bins.59]